MTLSLLETPVPPYSLGISSSVDNALRAYAVALPIALSVVLADFAVPICSLDAAPLEYERSCGCHRSRSVASPSTCMGEAGVSVSNAADNNAMSSGERKCWPRWPRSVSGYSIVDSGEVMR